MLPGGRGTVVLAVTDTTRALLAQAHARACGAADRASVAAKRAVNREKAVDHVARAHDSARAVATANTTRDAAWHAYVAANHATRATFYAVAAADAAVTVQDAAAAALAAAKAAAFAPDDVAIADTAAAAEEAAIVASNGAYGAPPTVPIPRIGHRLSVN
ncbi:hypothetical protein DFR70_108177 [Nocardia tenerifensis]|uniref:Uncharacterized protein n=1 Tax=Nocardia tenerifensis TaxID=228006 RepID=A0A318JXY2_9NOCA|nr:hypothetical protein [Nocardia tenerifensis]PXX61619.1 hypothetical protein DFR70_108177 [Nocardia tenerifensis]